MWSDALVIGVAAFASVIFIGFGITVAIKIERRKHRRILQEHGIVLSRTPRRYDLWLHNASRKSRDFRAVSVLQSRMNETWLPVNSLDEHDYETVDSVDEIVEPEPTIRNIIRSSLLPLSRRSSHRLKRLMKSAPLNPSMHSPLSVIAGSIYSTSLDTPITSEHSPEDNELSPRVLWPFLTSDITKTVRESSTSHHEHPKKRDTRIQTGLTNFVIGSSSICIGRSVSDGPMVPLSGVPSQEPRECSIPLAKSSSNASLDTISGSGLVEFSASSPKTETQALNEFDFGLDVELAEFETPARQVQEGLRGQRAAIVSSRGSFDYRTSANIEMTNLVRSGWSQHLSSPFRRVTQSSSDIEGVCSNFVTGTYSHVPSIDFPHVSTFKHDQFEVSASSRPASSNIGHLTIWKPDSSTPMQIHTPSLTDPKNRGHRRQNCMRISIPVAEPRKRDHFCMPQVEEEPIDDPNHSSDAVTYLKSGGIRRLLPPFMNLRNVDVSDPKSKTAFPSNSPTSLSKIDSRMGPGGAACSSPPRRRDLLTLPSPAYDSGEVSSRRTKVRGPRSPPRPSQQVRRKPGAANLRKSTSVGHNIMMREDSSSNVAAENYTNSKITRDSRTVACDSDIHKTNVESKSPLSSPPSTPRNAMSISQSRISIWEDVSMHGDFSRIDMPTLSVRNKPPSSIPFTPRNSSVDHEAYENMIGSSQLMNSASSLECNGVFGLGLQFRNAEQTPRSLYDCQGFLKD